MALVQENRAVLPQGCCVVAKTESGSEDVKGFVSYSLRDSECLAVWQWL